MPGSSSSNGASILSLVKRTKRRPARKVIRAWAQARALLERWRKTLVNLRLEMKRPRVIDVVPVDFLRGEPAEREGQPSQKFRGRLIFFTNADVTIRRPSGAILVIDNYEIVAISDGKTRFEPL